MFNTLKRAIRNWADKPETPKKGFGAVLKSTAQLEGIDSPAGIRFKIIPARGGFIIETATYNRQTDRNNYDLFVLQEDAELGEEIGKIVAILSLG